VAVNGADVDGVNLTIINAHSVNGIVRDTDGKTASGADVYYRLVGSTEFDSVKASENGVFTLTLPCGEYEMYASNSIGKGGMKKITVSEGNNRIELTVPANEYTVTAKAEGVKYTISGIAEYSDGSPAEGVIVILYDEAGNKVDETVSGNGGKWQFIVEKSGNYVIVVALSYNEDLIRAEQVRKGLDRDAMVPDTVEVAE